MNCSNCGNDLLVEVAPTGAGKLLRLLSVASYTCVRCGKTTTVVASKARVALVCLLIAAVLGLAALFAMEHALRDTRNSVRRTVDTTSAPLPPAATPDGRADAQTSAPAVPPASDEPRKTMAGPQPASTGGRTAVNPQALAPAAPTVSTKEMDAAAPATANTAASPAATDGVGAKAAAAVPASSADQAPPAAPGSASAQAAAAAQPSVASRPDTFPAPASATAGAASQEPQEAPLDEVVVAAPPKPVRPDGTGNTEASAGAAGWSATLSAVRSGVWNGALVVHLDASGTMGAPKGFALASPPRYVVDVPGTWKYAGEHSLAIDNAPATALRLGLHEDKLRVVLDLTRPVQSASVRRTTQGLTITIR